MNNSNLYDTVPYRGYPYLQTHPARLATLATLFGMAPAAVESCRVLELGCGDGSNVIPMAVHLPQSEFVGVDSAKNAIANGVALIRELGLTNIRLYEKDLVEYSTAERFDYIIAHGIYSWVAPPVRDKILSICRANLAPQGVAFLSYNTFPGGHLRRMIREMMLFHVRNITDPQEKIEQARALLSFVCQMQPAGSDHTSFIKNELEFGKSRADDALFHDDLAEINSPVYFWQLIEHAAHHGLQFLSEAYLSETAATFLDPELARILRQGDISFIAQEQYLDFVRCRKFRQTLLCHNEVTLDRSIKPERMKSFYVASSILPISAQSDLKTNGLMEQFRIRAGGVVSTEFPLAKAVLTYLGRIWPSSTTVNELLTQAYKMIDDSDKRIEQRIDEVDALCEFLLAGYAAGFVDLQVHPPMYVTKLSDRPMASALSRLQAHRGGYLTSLRHTMIEVKDLLGRSLVTALDGTRDRASLLQMLISIAQTGALDSSCGLTQENSPDYELLEQKLEELARLALLIA